ncbi:uncharacterized protein LOC125947587 [Dermacentor silvarum]|uniref:uncharacterized protein LOC125947587 n=1 Tax=Dermacentor silvarum TaxID=543639 RepID=UPI00210170A6|nr:uncharacterized protein LOC125947587 [Dermacentor silvarum]
MEHGDHHRNQHSRDNFRSRNMSSVRSKVSVPFSPWFSLSYEVVLPPLPTGRAFINSVFLHCGVERVPYRTDDFAKEFKSVGVLHEIRELKACGLFQYRHVWLATLSSLQMKQRLVDTRELYIKEEPCLVIDPNETIVIRLNWVPGCVPNEAICRSLGRYGIVHDISGGMWSHENCLSVQSTSRSVRMILHPGCTVDTLPRRIRVGSSVALLAVPGRAPLLKLAGHICQERKVPRCEVCGKCGHATEDCVKTYAAITNTYAVAEDSPIEDDHSPYATQAQPIETKGEVTSEPPKKKQMLLSSAGQEGALGGDGGVQASITISLPESSEEEDSFRQSHQQARNLVPNIRDQTHILGKRLRECSIRDPEERSEETRRRWYQALVLYLHNLWPEEQHT